MITVANVAFALIVTVFSPQTEGLARADVFVIDHNLTAEDCFGMMQELDPNKYGDNSTISCSFDYDY
jgi:hypothetical protein